MHHHAMPGLLEKVRSTRDEVTKYVTVTDDGLIVELSHIDNGTGKDIVCVPCQTMCGMGCLFCHTTDHLGEIECRNLDSYEIGKSVKEVVRDMGKSHDVLLVSYMGCGEPLSNYHHVLDSMVGLARDLRDEPPFYSSVRFGVATSFPRSKMAQFSNFCSTIRDFGLQVKLHASLHYTEDASRSKWMPASASTASVIMASKMFREVTGQKVEMHYAPISGVNDSLDDARRLADMLDGGWANVKFLYYNEKDSLDAHAATLELLEGTFYPVLTERGIGFEYYVPPGIDVGSSCGMFLMEQYAKHGSGKARAEIGNPPDGADK